MARTDPQVNFRIPAELKDKLDAAAKENNRTITAELILRLEATFAKDDEVQELRSILDQLYEQVQRIEEDYGRSIETLEMEVKDVYREIGHISSHMR